MTIKVCAGIIINEKPLKNYLHFPTKEIASNQTLTRCRVNYMHRQIEFGREKFISVVLLKLLET